MVSGQPLRAAPGGGSVNHVPPDPWEDYDSDDVYGGDALYEGDREHIPDLILLTEVLIAFEFWAEDFRYWDESPEFSELMSVKLAKREVEL